MKRNTPIEIVDARPEHAAPAARLMAAAWWDTYADSSKGIRHNLRVLHSCATLIRNIPLRRQITQEVADENESGDHRRAYLIATLGRRVVGLSYVAEPMMPAMGDGKEIRSLYVKRKMRGRGVGSALIEAAQARYPESSLGLGVVQDNDPAIGFYEAQGFSLVADSQGEAVASPVPGAEYLEQVVMRRPATVREDLDEVQ